jgi:hypothetical protein
MRSIQKETVECLNTKIENLEYFREEDGKKTQAEDETISDLEDELADTEEAITVEVEKFSRRNAKLNPNFPKISIDVFSDFEGKISIALIYGASFFFLTLSIFIDIRGGGGNHVAVHRVKWNAGYDIRVDTKKKDKPVTLTYKAGITQATGEVRIASSYHAVPHLSISRIGTMFHSPSKLLLLHSV